MTIFKSIIVATVLLVGSIFVGFSTMPESLPGGGTGFGGNTSSFSGGLWDIVSSALIPKDSRTLGNTGNRISEGWFTTLDVSTCTGCSSFAFPFTATTNYGAATNATSTPIWFQSGLQASSTSHFGALDILTALGIASGGTNASSQATNGVNFFNGTSITSGSVLTFSGTQLSTTDLTTTNATSTGKLNIPNGATPSVVTTGDVAIDTTSDQLVGYGTGAKKVYGNGNIYAGFTYATSTAWTGTSTIPLGTARIAELWNDAQCYTDTGTLNISVNDGTNRMNMFNASTTVGTVGFTTNNTFTSAEKRYVDIGTPASTPTKISCTFSRSITAD